MGIMYFLIIFVKTIRLCVCVCVSVLSLEEVEIVLNLIYLVASILSTIDLYKTLCVCFIFQPVTVILFDAYTLNRIDRLTD